MPANHYFVADHQAAAVHYPSTASTLAAGQGLREISVKAVVDVGSASTL